MKKIAILLLLVLAFSPSAHAVQKKVTVKKITTVMDAPNAQMLLVSKASIITIATVDSLTTDVAISAVDGAGALLWQNVIDSGSDEVAMASTVDGAGNIWISGFSSPLTGAVIETAAVTAENPDAISFEPTQPLRGDLNVLTVWKIAPSGELLATYRHEHSRPGLISSMSVNSSGLSLAGVLSERAFIQSMNVTGQFSPQTFIGTGKTIINAVVRNSDGTLFLFGSSNETLAGKKLAGIRDGVLIKASKAGVISSVVRSSAIKGDRSWLSADSNLLLSGFVKSGKTTESAITKFTTTFTPTWTIRFASTGQSRALSAGGTSYAAFGSKSAIASITGWKPSKAQLLVTTFDSKGVMTNAFGSAELGDPIALAYSKELGVVGLANKADQTPAIFRLATR
jgi:hypothetical protein